jgi:Domain of unknown function (DUF222)/HNH endonuclease
VVGVTVHDASGRSREQGIVRPETPIDAVHYGGAVGVSMSQARILSSALNPRTVDVFMEHEAGLVDTAAPLNAAQTEFLITHWLRMADPDGTERSDNDAEAGRRFDVRETLPGQWWIDGRCTAEQAVVLGRSVEALLSTWLRDTTDTRSVAQMRMDAIVEVCRQWLTFGETPLVSDERPHININVDLDQLLHGRGRAFDDNGAPVPATKLSEYLCDGVLTRILSTGSVILDVGRNQRTVTKAQRLAVKQRDRHCRHPGCARPASQCDVHHIIEWLNGGRTDLSNLVLLCRFHHGYLHNTDSKPRSCPTTPSSCGPKRHRTAFPPTTSQLHRQRPRRENASR